MADNQPVSVVVEYQIRAENTSMSAWLDEWSLRAQDADQGEPETAAYAAATNLEAPENILVFERYRHGDQSLQRHVERPAHEHLTTTMGERNMTRRRVMSSMFNDLEGYGWWGRPETREGTDAGQILVLLGMRFESSVMRDDFLNLSGEHAIWCWENEPDTTVYSGGLARRDADRELDLKQGDLVLVMACTDMDAVIRHRDEPHHLALGERIEQQGIRMTNTFQRTYRTTGHGFLWRES